MRKCRCHHIPEEGCFKIGNIYEWCYVIDGIYVIDDNGEKIDLFNEITFYCTLQSNKICNLKTELIKINERVG